MMGAGVERRGTLEESAVCVWSRVCVGVRCAIACCCRLLLLGLGALLRQHISAAPLRAPS